MAELSDLRVHHQLQCVLDFRHRDVREHTLPGGAGPVAAVEQGEEGRGRCRGE